MHNFRSQTPPPSFRLKCKMSKIKQLKIMYYLNFFLDAGKYNKISDTGKLTQFKLFLVH